MPSMVSNKIPRAEAVYPLSEEDIACISHCIFPGELYERNPGVRRSSSCWKSSAADRMPTKLQSGTQEGKSDLIRGEPEDSRKFKTAVSSSIAIDIAAK